VIPTERGYYWAKVLDKEIIVYVDIDSHGRGEAYPTGEEDGISIESEDSITFLEGPIKRRSA
jgi:hypothetical protein